ncbi:MAG: DUF167 domain-containing protein [Gemmatimonadaceae bacterium]
MHLRVHVQPRASRNEIVGLHGDALKVRLQAPPVDDAANEALVQLIATALGLPRGAVRIIAGARARSKVVEVVGASPEQIAQLATKSSSR